MRKQFAVPAIAAAVLALSAGLALAQQRTTAGTTRPTAGTPPAATAGSQIGERHGANDPNFCPPGQAKKPGRGKCGPLPTRR